MLWKAKKKKKKEEEELDAGECTEGHTLRRCMNCEAIGCAYMGCVHQTFQIHPRGERCKSCRKVVQVERLRQ